MITSTNPNTQLQTNLVGEFVIHKDGQSRYWCNGQGWVDRLEQASGFSEEEVLAGRAAVVHWKKEECYEATSEEYWWSSRKDRALLGYRGADFNGPFHSRHEAVLDAIDWIGIRPKVLGEEGAEFVVKPQYNARTDFPKLASMEIAA